MSHEFLSTTSDDSPEDTYVPLMAEAARPRVGCSIPIGDLKDSHGSVDTQLIHRTFAESPCDVVIVELADDEEGCEDLDDVAQALSACGIELVTRQESGELPWLRFDPRDPDTAWTCAWFAAVQRLSHGNSWMYAPSLPTQQQILPLPRPGQLPLWLLSLVARGADTCAPVPWQSASSIPFTQPAFTTDGRVSTRINRELSQWAASVHTLAGKLPHITASPIGIIYQPPCSEEAMNSDNSLHIELARAWHRAFWEAGFESDLVLAQADFSAYRILIVPGVISPSPTFADSLERAVAAGAQVIVNAMPHGDGVATSLSHCVGVSLLSRSRIGSEHSGTSYTADEHARTEMTRRLSRTILTPSAHRWAGIRAVHAPMQRMLDHMAKPAPDLRGRAWIEELALAPQSCPDPDKYHAFPEEALPYAEFWGTLDADVEAIALFDGTGAGADYAGFAAITRRPQGKGAAWCVATQLDDLGMHAVLSLAALYARIHPTLPGLPDGVEAIRRGHTLFLLNHSDRAVELSAINGIDLLTENVCTGHVMLPPRSAMVVDTQDDGS